MNTSSVGFARVSAATFVLSLLAGFFMFTVAQAFTGTFVANQTVANLSAINDQSAVTATTQANQLVGADNTQGAVTATPTPNVPETKASQTLTVVGVPVGGESIIIGSCTVLYDAATTTDSNCADSVATINTTGAVAADIAAGLRALTNVSDPAHGTLAVTGAGADAVFTTSVTEASATSIAFTNNTGGDTTNVAVTGVVPVAQVSTVTPANVEVGDTFTATINGLPVNFVATAATVANVTAGLTSAINGSAQAPNVTAVDNTAYVQITSDAAGTAFTVSSGATNRAAAAQTNTITITGTVETGDTFTATLPTVGAVSYVVQAGDTTVDNVAIGLNAAIQASANYALQDFTSGVATNVITLTAKVAGTGFVQTSGTTNRTPVAQVVTWTFANATAGETFRATVDSINYDHTVVSPVNTIAIVQSIANAIDNSPAVGCSQNGIDTVTCTASAPGTSFTFAGSVVDITAPVVSEVTPVTTPTNDATPNYTFTTNEAGTINYAGDCSSVTTTAATSSNTITFNTLSTGTHSNCQISVTDLFGNTSASTTVSSFLIDTTAPTVAVTSTKPNGSYSTSTAINVTLTFSEPVTSTQSLTVTLETGATDRTCVVPAMTSATVGTCTYTVQAGDTSSDLAISSIVVNSGGTIKDAATNNANLVPTSNISDTSNIVIDTTDPVVTGVSYAPTSGILAIGDVLTLTIAADAAGYTLGSATVNGVTVTGFTDNGNNTYTAYYTVTSGDSDRANTEQIPVSVVLKDAGNNTNAPFATAPAAGLTPAVDANAPAVSAADLTAGTDSGISSIDNITNVSTPTFTGTAEVGSTVRLYDGNTQIGSYLASGGTWTITSSVLSEGVHLIGATATDAVGNTSATSSTLSVTVDTIAPTVSTPDLDISSDTGLSQTDNVTSDNTPAFSGTGEDGTVVLYDGALAVGSGIAASNVWNNLTTSVLSDGGHTVTAVNTDAAGNASATSTGLTVTIDTTLPVLTEDTAVTNPTNNTAPSYKFHSTEAGAVTYGGDCSSGTAAAGVGTTTVIFNTLSAAIHSNCTIMVTDSAGKQSLPLSVSAFVIDTTSPTVAITSGVPSYTNVPFSVTITFSEPTSDFTVADVSVTNGTASNFATTSATIYTVQINPIATGSNVDVTVNAGAAHDAATNPNTAGNTVSSFYDTSTPTLTSVSIASNNASTTLAKAGDTITVSFSASEFINTPVVTINGHAASPSGTFAGPYTAIYQMTNSDTDGPISFAVDFTDLATNAGTQVTSITNGSAVVFDNTPPVATVTTSDTDGVFSSTTVITVTATFSEPVQDSPVPTIAAFGADSFASTTMTKVDSTHYTYAYSGGAGNGIVTFSVGSAVDLVGNTEAGESGSIILDNTPPVITVTGSNPDTIVTSNTAYADAGATATDNHDSSVTVISSGSVNNLVAGTYTISYSATDASGNVGTLSRSVVVNSTGNGPVSGGGGGGPLFVGTVTVPQSPVLSVPGQVLGASSYHFTLALNLGAQGEEVRALQQVLIAEGFLHVPAATDYFGPLTQAALKLYQAKHGIPQTGTVGPLTRAQLNKGAALGSPKLPENQISAILNLLTSFDVDAAVLKTVNSILHGN